MNGPGHPTSSAGSSADPIVVVAAVIERDGRFLLTRRLAGTHLAGRWEFPGGKCEAGESHTACLEREIREELNASITIGALVFSVEHAYSDRTVRLHFYAAILEGQPHARLGQEMRWVPRGELTSLEFPEADHALIERLSTG